MEETLHVAFKINKLHLVHTKRGRRLNKARDSLSGTRDLWQPGYVVLPKLGVALTRVPVMPRSECCALIKRLILSLNPGVL
jgi:hypothetical protein